MSGLGRVPSFEPDEEAKAMLEEMFAQKKEEKKEEPKKEEGKKPRHRIRIPEPPAQTVEEQEKAAVHAKEEMEILREAFLEFGDKVSELVVYGYLFPEIQDLVESFEDMDILLADNVNKDELTVHGLPDYEKMRKLRARILHDIYEKYEKGK